MENSEENLLTNNFALFCYACWVLSGFVGAVYWAVKDDLLDVVLSIFIPLYGIVTVFVDLLL